MTENTVPTCERDTVVFQDMAFHGQCGMYVRHSANQPAAPKHGSTVEPTGQRKSNKKNNNNKKNPRRISGVFQNKERAAEERQIKLSEQA